MSNYPNKLSYREFKLKNIVRSGKGPFEFGHGVRYEDGNEVEISSFFEYLGKLLICICVYFLIKTVDTIFHLNGIFFWIVALGIILIITALSTKPFWYAIYRISYYFNVSRFERK